MKTPYMYLFSTLLLLSIAGCGADNQETASMKSMEQLHQEHGVPVKTEVVTLQSLTLSHSFNAVLTGVQETTANAMVSDNVTAINYEVGDRVPKDAVVITFPTDTPTAQYYQAKASFEHAQTTLGRFKNLYENGGISLQEYDTAKTQFEVAQANWDAVQQTVTVKAPISGVLTNLAVRVADHVSPGDPLFTIALTERLKIRIWATENQINDISVGNRATAEWQGMILEGSVVQVDQSLDESKQAFGVIAEFDNPGSRIMSGVNANVLIHGVTADGAIIIARKNVLHDGDSNYVFLAKNGIAEKRTVHLGRNVGIDVEIQDGLQPGDTLITEGQMLLDDTARIMVRQ